MNDADKARIIREAHEDAFHRIACQNLDTLKANRDKKIADGSISVADLHKIDDEIAKCAEDVVVSRDCLALRHHIGQHGTKEKLLEHHQGHCAVATNADASLAEKLNAEKAIADCRDLAAIWDADKKMDERVAKLKS